jgi:hypothetical protein
LGVNRRLSRVGFEASNPSIQVLNKRVVEVS